MSLKTSRDRLSMMCDENQRTWDLSPKDVEAISDVLAALEGAEAAIAQTLQLCTGHDAVVDPQTALSLYRMALDHLRDASRIAS